MIIIIQPFSAYLRASARQLFRLLSRVFACCLLSFHLTAQASESPPQDPHRNEAGFFDIHVCNWPKRPLFFMALFSTTRFSELVSVEILDPDNRHIGYLDITRYRPVNNASTPEKRAFISQFDVPADAADGWYQSVVTLKDGSRHRARDFVVVHSMDRPLAINPPDAAENIARPKLLQWQAVAGAKYYQVFIRDEWEGKLVYESGLLARNELAVPDELLVAGGYYSWIIHARDINESVLLGDFNHGSLSPSMTFSISEN